MVTLFKKLLTSNKKLKMPSTEVPNLALGSH